MLGPRSEIIVSNVKWVKLEERAVLGSKEIVILTVAAPMMQSSKPTPGHMVLRKRILMPPKSRAHANPRDVAITIHAVWSFSVTTANGGE